MNRDRKISIDCLRGVGALLVVFYHAWLFNLAKLWESGHKAVSYLPYQSFVGVHLFLVVSGYCIHYRACTADPNQNPDFLSFWVRRLRRLYPPYLAAVLLTIACVAATGALTQWVRSHTISWSGLTSLMFEGGMQEFINSCIVHFFMAFPLWNGATDVLGNWVFWSLALEEQLYMLYFLLPGLRRKWGIECTVVFVGLVSMVWRAWFILGPLGPLQPRMFRGGELGTSPTGSGLAGIAWLDLGPSRWFEWVLGVLAVEIATGRCADRPIYRNPLLAMAAFSGALVCQWSTVGWVLTDPLWGIGFFILINRMVAREASDSGYAGKLWMRILAAVGLFSYSLYLIHHPLLNLVSLVLLKFMSFQPARWVSIAVTIGLSYLFYLAVERPAMNWAKGTGRSKGQAGDKGSA